MIDISKTIEAKSDQLNADDLLGGPRILKITAVKAGTGEQPVSLSYEGDNGKPWKPSKGMRRVLVAAWGADGEAYVGRSVEVYCEPAVKWAGEAVGGIRVARMSDIKNAIVMPLTLTRGKKTPVTIRPLDISVKKALTIEDRQKKTLDLIYNAGVNITKEIETAVFACVTPEQLKAVFESSTQAQK